MSEPRDERYDEGEEWLDGSVFIEGERDHMGMAIGSLNGESCVTAAVTVG
jgi:hypothetical protein